MNVNKKQRMTRIVQTNTLIAFNRERYCTFGEGLRGADVVGQEDNMSNMVLDHDSSPISQISPQLLGMRSLFPRHVPVNHNDRDLVRVALGVVIVRVHFPSVSLDLCQASVGIS